HARARVAHGLPRDALDSEHLVRDASRLEAGAPASATMIELDGTRVREAIRPGTDDARFRKAIDNLAGDRLLLSLFLMNGNHGEGAGEASVAANGQDEMAALLHEVRRRQRVEPRSTESTKLVVEELFPEFFEHGQYRYEDVVGRDYYFSVREANRRRLRER